MEFENGFEEYQQDYPNGDFDVSDMTPECLAKWCESVGDFLYIYEGMSGLSIMAANNDRLVNEIVDDLYNCERIEPTHEVDYLLSSRGRYFENDYVCVFKVVGSDDGDYYIIYQQDKWNGLNESRQNQINQKTQRMVAEAVRRVMKKLFIDTNN